jgi:hypothetical protein
MSAAGVEIDLTEARRAAEEVRALLGALRERFDLSPFEFTRAVRVAPGEIPHSHPVLTLNTMTRRDEDLLAVYLHEQMHWALTWWSHARPDAWRALWRDLVARHPDPPVAFPDGARDLASSHLHLIVNFLEIEALAQLLGREKAREIAARQFVYRGLYRIVLDDYAALAELYARAGLLPLSAATSLSAEDLALAACMEEASL